MLSVDAMGYSIFFFNDKFCGGRLVLKQILRRRESLFVRKLSASGIKTLPAHFQEL